MSAASDRSFHKLIGVHRPAVARLTQRKPPGALGCEACGMTTNIPFDQLLRAAAEQPEPQRLLFVFASAELPNDSTPAQSQRFEAGHGGALTPVICVDKAPAQLTRFDALLAESLEAGPPWQVVFAAGLSGRDGQPPSQPKIEQALSALVERVCSGRIEGLLALDTAGQVLEFL